MSHHAVEGGCPVDVQALQQSVGDLDLLRRSVARDVQAFTEVSQRLIPVTVSERHVALIQQVAD